MSACLERNRVHVGDVLDLAGRLEPGSVQTIITSPPYFGLRDYGIPPTVWPALEYAPLAGLPHVSVPAMTACLGLEPTIEAYIGHIVAVFRALRPALKDDGTLWLNLGDSYWTKPIGKGSTHDPKWAGGRSRAEGNAGGRTARAGQHKNLMGIPWRVAFALQADGWCLRSDIVWHKPAPMPESCTDRPTKAHEYLFLLTRHPRYFYDAEAIKEPAREWKGQAGTFARAGGKMTTLAMPGQHHSSHRGDRDDRVPTATRNKRSVWEIASIPFPDAHYATFPPALVRPCLLAGSSAHGECSACGRAWVRVTESRNPSKSENVGADRSGGAARTSNPQTSKGLHRNGGGVYSTRQSRGFRPQCSCDPTVRPQLVLDPFAGSCTTWEVAHTEGRDFIGIDLDDRAVRWGTERLAKLPMGHLMARVGHG